jgi:hypothetical protein
VPDRHGWPLWAQERLECANCGGQAYHQRSAPHRLDASFPDWVRLAWPGGDAQQTQWGFMIWCSGQCKAVWAEKRRGLEEDTAQKEWRRDMEGRRIRAGL